MSAPWDDRFNREEYVYGTAPNEFLVESVGHLPRAPARILSVGEGEGRNATFLASLGYQVTAVDSSSVGLDKASRLATSRGLSIETIVSDLGEYRFSSGAWEGVVSIFCHLPPALRRQVHRRAAEALRPGGVLIMEAYTPAQLEFRTGGPPVRELLYTLEELRDDFASLELLVAREVERDVVEGTLHTGRAAVVQLVGKRV